MLLKLQAKSAVCAVSALALSCLSGCGVDDVQLNGKIFDVVGMNTGSVKAKEPKLAERQPLIVPPGLENLPQPGSGKAEQPVLAGVEDVDAKRQTSRADLEKQQAEYCKKNYELAKVHGAEDAENAAGPLGPCRGSILSAIKKWNGDGEAEEQ